MNSLDQYAMTTGSLAEEMAEMLDGMGVKPCEQDDLGQQWLNMKAIEKFAIDRRRQIEDALVETLRVDITSEGTSTSKIDGYKVRVTTRLSRKVDGDLLQEIAAEHGLSEHLPELFRWKPEISIKAWKNADESITRPLLGAITTTPGRPGFQITREED